MVVSRIAQPAVCARSFNEPRPTGAKVGLRRYRLQTWKSGRVCFQMSGIKRHPDYYLKTLS